MSRFGRSSDSLRRTGRRLFVESLEDRQLMAADLDFLSSAANKSAGIEAEPDLEILRDFPTQAPETETAVSGAIASGLSAALSPLTNIPVLNSLAGAAVSLYLDFNGHFESLWGAYRNITTPVFDQDGDATTFSDGELTTIRKIWSVVAEDFSPFNINVTTVEPGTIANGRAIRAAIGGDSAWLGGGAGGVAYVDSFTNSIPNTVYVFADELANGYWRYVGEATSHEAGHSFGLDHQSLFNTSGGLLDEYNSGTSARAPIMGNSYTSTRGLWWSGTDSYNTNQDDLSVLSRAANGFGYRADDHGNSAASASALVIAEDRATGSGIITTTSDVDYFSFTTGAGPVSFTVEVPAGINNLDSRLELRNSVGTLIASAAPTTTFGATITATLADGSYRLVVGSQGNYGDIGQYTVSGTFVPVENVVVDSPSNLTATHDAGGVTLSWTDNASNETSVLVERRAAGGAWAVVATLPANATSYRDLAVTAGSTYEYRVLSARDAIQSNYSGVVAVTLAPSAPTGLAASVVSSTRVNLVWVNVAGESGYKVERLTGGVWTQIATTAADVVNYSDTTAAAGAIYQYRVRATNSGGDSAYSPSAAVTMPNTLSAPAAPSSLTAFVNVNRRVQLSWRDNSANESMFVVQRSTNQSTWTTLGQVSANVTGAIDLTAVRGRTYYYRVFAYNNAGYSAASNSARIVFPIYSRSTSTKSAGNAATIQKQTAGMPALPTRRAETTSSFTAASVPAAMAASPGHASSAEADQWQRGVDAFFSNPLDESR